METPQNFIRSLFIKHEISPEGQYILSRIIRYLDWRLYGHEYLDAVLGIGIQ